MRWNRTKRARSCSMAWDHSPCRRSWGRSDTDRVSCREGWRVPSSLECPGSARRAWANTGGRSGCCRGAWLCSRAGSVSSGRLDWDARLWACRSWAFVEHLPWQTKTIKLLSKNNVSWQTLTLYLLLRTFFVL